MRNLARIAIVLSLSSALTHSAFAETLYVNNLTGSNRNSGLTPDNQGDGIGPLRSIATALKLVERGDSIELANTDVPYQECITLQGRKNSGFELLPFVIEGNGATLDGTAEIPADAWDYVTGDLYRFKPRHGGYQVLFLDGTTAKQLPRFDGSMASTFLQPLEWCRCQGGIHFMSEKGKSPYSYDLRYAKHRVGITLYDVQHIVIRNLVVRGFQVDGINAHDNAMECALVDVASTGNGRSGISINGASRVTIANCRASENGEVDLRCDNWSTTKLIRTEFTNKKRPVWTRYVNYRGQGARLFVDGKQQTELQGWLPSENGDEPMEAEGLEPTEPLAPQVEAPKPTPVEPPIDQPPSDLIEEDQPISPEMESDELFPAEEPAEPSEEPDLFESDESTESDDGDLFDSDTEDADMDLFEGGGDDDLFGDF